MTDRYTKTVLTTIAIALCGAGGTKQAISGTRNESSSISTCVERVARRFRLHGNLPGICAAIRRLVLAASPSILSSSKRYSRQRPASMLK